MQLIKFLLYKKIGILLYIDLGEWGLSPVFITYRIGVLTPTYKLIEQLQEVSIKIFYSCQ
jgi:hypothetical protein